MKVLHTILQDLKFSALVRDAVNKIKQGKDPNVRFIADALLSLAHMAGLKLKNATPQDVEALIKAIVNLFV